MKKLTIALTAIIIISSTLASFAGDIYHQRGIEIRGGLSMYLFMDDPNDWAKQIAPSLSDEMEFAPDFGVSLLYKSHNNFVWNIGYNHMFVSKAAYTIQGDDYEESVSANEFFLVPSFVLYPEGKLSLSLGLGPSLIMANLDRTSPESVYGNMREFCGASGRNMGIMGLANIEYLLKPNLGIKIGGGFRSVFIDDIDFIKTDANGTDTSYSVWWTDAAGTETNQPYELDFSGVFGEIGLRWYFTPKKLW